MDAIGEVNGAFIPLKTLVIAGDNTHAMGAIANVKNAMETLKDKTVYITTVVRTINRAAMVVGWRERKDNRLPPNMLRDNAAPIVFKVADTVIVRDDKDLAYLEGVIDNRFAKLLNR